MGDPSKIPELERRRHEDAIAEARGISKYEVYSEKEAMHILRPSNAAGDTSWLKRNRKLVPHAPTGTGQYRYWGIHLIHYLLYGPEAWKLWGEEPPEPETVQ